MIRPQLSEDGGKTWVDVGSEETWRLLGNEANGLAYAETITLVEHQNYGKWKDDTLSRLVDDLGSVLATGEPMKKIRSIAKSDQTQRVDVPSLSFTIPGRAQSSGLGDDVERSFLIDQFSMLCKEKARAIVDSLIKGLDSGKFKVSDGVVLEIRIRSLKK